VEDVAKKFPGEVVRIKHSFSRDWDGDPAIYFRVVLTDEALSHYQHLTELTGAIKSALMKDLAFYQSEYAVYNPYFNFRTEAEQKQLRDPEWE
jgi:hypothetical protein